MALFMHSSNSLIYFESSGWPMPEGLLEYVQAFDQGLSKQLVPLLDAMNAHDPTSEQGHRCLEGKCLKNYPFQRCSNICGVAATKMMVMIDPSTFHNI